MSDPSEATLVRLGTSRKPGRSMPRGRPRSADLAWRQIKTSIQALMLEFTERRECVCLEEIQDLLLTSFAADRLDPLQLHIVIWNLELCRSAEQAGRGNDGLRAELIGALVILITPVW